MSVWTPPSPLDARKVPSDHQPPNNDRRPDAHARTAIVDACGGGWLGIALTGVIAAQAAGYKLSGGSQVEEETTS